VKIVSYNIIQHHDTKIRIDPNFVRRVVRHFGLFKQTFTKTVGQRNPLEDYVKSIAKEQEGKNRASKGYT
jgi:hypothetical protein